jgi:hypothetical protein
VKVEKFTDVKNANPPSVSEILMYIYDHFKSLTLTYFHIIPVTLVLSALHFMSTCVQFRSDFEVIGAAV